MADYLAVITTPYGGGSYARSSGGKETKEQVAKRCRRIFEQDWKSLFKVKPGAKLKANVIEVTDLDSVTWDESGFYADGKLLDRPIEVIEV